MGDSSSTLGFSKFSRGRARSQDDQPPSSSMMSSDFASSIPNHPRRPSPPALNTLPISDSDSAVKVHQKIQSQYSQPFARRIDAKLKQKEATSPIAGLSSISRPNGFDFSVDNGLSGGFQSSIGVLGGPM